MDIFGYVVLALTVAALLFAVAIYNRLVNLKHNATKAWSNIDVLLKQRHDELPKLVATCKEYMKYEKDTLEKVMEARQKPRRGRPRGRRYRRAGRRGGRAAPGSRPAVRARRGLSGSQGQRNVPASAGAHQRLGEFHRRST